MFLKLRSLEEAAQKRMVAHRTENRDRTGGMLCRQHSEAMEILKRFNKRVI